MTRLFYILLLLINVFIIKSQAAWDLQQCINYAINHNISLKQSALNNQINKNNTNQIKASLLPSVNLGGSHVYNFGQTIDRFTNTFANTQVLSQNLYVSSNVILWSGLSQINNIKANEFTYLSGIETLKQQQNDLSLNIANAYIGVIFSEEILKISQNQFNISKEQLDRTQKLVNSGVIAKSVEFDIKAQLANELLNVTNSENNLNLSLLNLKQLMNFDSVTNFKIVQPDLNIETSAVSENNILTVYETSLKNQPSIKSGAYAILSAEKLLSASQGRQSPTLSFNASMGTGSSGLAKDIIGYRTSGYQITGITNKGDSVYAPLTELISQKKSFADQFKDNVNKSIGFTLSIPIFNGLQTSSAIKNAKLNAYNAKLAQDLTKQNLFKNIVQAQANVKAALNKYNASLMSLDAATESFKYAQQKFNAGVISSFDFSTSKNRLFAAESNLLQAKYDYIFKLKVIDYYKGNPLTF